MITPAFDLSQDPEYLILNIRVPYTRTSEFDLYIDGTDLKFYAKPYFLRLSLPGKIVEDGRERAKFDIDKGLFIVWVPKETPGEHFEGLQMLTSLLAPKGSRSAKPLIEVLSTESSKSTGNDEDEDEEEFDWSFEQEMFQESSEEKQKYGFGNKRTGVFARLQEEISDVTDVKNPEDTTAAERRQSRLHAEACDFSPDHYLADFFEDDEIQRLLKYKPWWAKLKPSKEPEGEASISFMDIEKEQLRKFNNRSYLLDKISRNQVWTGLVDILLAYSYEVRSTEGEHNVESPWTVRKLSGTLCWLETYKSLQEVLLSFGRRVLCYPLYRHFAMVSAAISDTALLLSLGKTCVLKCLLDIHKVFRENDPAYILNDLYITDYCIWIQKVKSKRMTALAEILQNASLHKKDLDLELEELEDAAKMVMEEEFNKQGTLESSLVAHSDSRSCSSDCSSKSADDSNDSEAEGQGCNKSNQGGELSKDNPLQPQPTSTVSPDPKVPQTLLFSAERKSDTLPSSSEDSRQLIQELGIRVADELKITQESSYKTLQNSSQLNNSAEKTDETSGRSSCGTFLEIDPCRNPLLVIQMKEDLDG
ncbi:protein SHQ1 homolog [Labrus bergylta]|uniref:protein SHQ1 homolog n=1 Tax=Labrus bergylta TaxID=56723 RepID=UPI0033139691